MGTDRALRSGASGEYVQRVAPDVSPSVVISKVVFWFIFIFALAIGLSSLGIQSLNEFLTSVLDYLPNIIAAILIFVLAIAIAGLRRAPRRGDGPGRGRADLRPLRELLGVIDVEAVLSAAGLEGQDVAALRRRLTPDPATASNQGRPPSIPPRPPPRR